MPKIVQIDAKISWHARRSQTSDKWIAIADELNLSVEGDSLDELHSLIPEMFHLLMIDLLEDNEIEAFLTERGWRTAGGMMPQHDGPDDFAFEAPWELVAEGARGSERRAH